MSVKEF